MLFSYIDSDSIVALTWNKMVKVGEMIQRGSGMGKKETDKIHQHVQQKSYKVPTETEQKFL